MPRRNARCVTASPAKAARATRSTASAPSCRPTTSAQWITQPDRPWRPRPSRQEADDAEQVRAACRQRTSTGCRLHAEPEVGARRDEAGSALPSAGDRRRGDHDGRGRPVPHAAAGGPRGAADQPVRGSGRVRGPSRAVRHGPGADPRGSAETAPGAACATPTPSPTGRSWTCGSLGSGGRRWSSSPSPRSTSSSFCWPGTAACTGRSRRGSAARPVIRRCNRSSRRGASVRTRGSPAWTATSAKARKGSSTRRWAACGSSSSSRPIPIRGPSRPAPRCLRGRRPYVRLFTSAGAGRRRPGGRHPGIRDDGANARR